MMFVYPLDFARTRMGADVGKEIADRQFKSLTHCMQKIYTMDGIGGLYQGVGISLFSNFIYRGLYFGAYDTGKEVFANQLQDSFFYKWCFAQVVTNFSEIVSYPFDTIRRRLMMNSGLEKPIYSGTMDCIRKVNLEGGVQAFFKGNLSNMIRSLSSSLVLVLYDQLKTWAKNAGH